ncbi:unnamed protein product, partial [Ectocarpus sp. 12 AP-2014]
RLPECIATKDGVQVHCNGGTQATHRRSVVHMLQGYVALVQDRVLADSIQSDGYVCVVVCNKCDLVKDKDDSIYNK